VSSIEVRAMRAEDLRAIAELSLRCFPDHGWWSVEELQDELQRSHSEAWVAEIDTNVVGFTIAWFAGDDGELLTIATDPGERRRGTARVLLSRLMRSTVERAVRSLTLEVRPSNLAARALYESLGFALTDLRPRYYVDGEDALVMVWTPSAP
jgi:[ribosomal protein S18]-alanine N-acetyltransferase